MSHEMFPRRQREPLIDLTMPQRIHVVGVGGPGMAPLAIVLAANGHIVSGSDLRESPTVDSVRTTGIDVTIGHRAELVDGADVVVYSTAIPESNVEMSQARKVGIERRHRSGLLGALCQQFETVGVAGTHGKSTTTALITHMLAACGYDPTSIIGADVPGMLAGSRSGSSPLFVLEADESDGTLEMLDLSHLVITNVDIDHLDYFGSFEALQDVMLEVVNNVTSSVVMNADDVVSMNLRQRSTHGNITTFGFSPSAVVQILSISPHQQGIEIALRINNRSMLCQVPLRGHHNGLNVSAALAMVHALGADLQTACDSLSSFAGVGRRFTERGHFHQALLVDDYAHLPAEIDAAISALRTHPDVTGKVVAVFQPNRFHRIAAMADAYADCFRSADRVVITDIYASGTQVIEGVTGKMVWQAIVNAHPDADVVWAPTRNDVVQAVATFVSPGDGCISMGCGDIETFPDDLMKASQ